MAEVTEVPLPGVGVRFEFTTEAGERIGVVAHRTGRRELVRYDTDDPDRCTTVAHLSDDDAHALGELLGATQVSEVMTEARQGLAGLSIDWLTVQPGSRFESATIGQGEFRTRTGASVVAIVRGDTTVPAPGPDVALEPGDVLVAVGTPVALGELRALLQP